jgi:hypothetical protein
MPLGFHFSYWKLSEDNKLSCVSKVVDSFAAYETKYISNTSNVHVVHSLDSFYSDPRNRRIKMAHAVWLVVNGLAGMPPNELDRMIENWRKNTTE